MRYDIRKIIERGNVIGLVSEGALTTFCPVGRVTIKKPYNLVTLAIHDVNIDDQGALQLLFHSISEFVSENLSPLKGE